MYESCPPVRFEMTATFYVGDAIQVMNRLPEKSVDLVLTSPPFLALRSYLPADHPDKNLEGGSQSTPGEYVDWLLDVVEACTRVLAPHGSLCFELGDTYAGFGGAGGDYLNAGLRKDQPAFDGSASRGRQQDREYDGGASDRWDFAKPGTKSRSAAGTGWPLAKSLSLIPETFRFAMVYGTNPHTGRTTEPWRLRNVIRWVRPNPPVGALGDKFRPATSELMVFCKAKDRFFDLDAVREPLKHDYKPYDRAPDSKAASRAGVVGEGPRMERAEYNPAGAPPLDWWKVEDGEPAKAVWWCLEHGASGASNDHCWQGMSFRQATGNKLILTECRMVKTILQAPPNPAGAPPLDWWNIPLLDGDEETVYGPKERRTAPEVGGPKEKHAREFRSEEVLAAMGDRTFHQRGGAPPLDWWEIPPGGYAGAHYAVWPPELLIKPIKAMTPEKVCRQCGEPSRRIVKDRTAFDRQPELAAHIRAQREAMRITHDEVNGWFGFKEIAKNWERTDKWGAAIPSAEVWPILKEKLNLSGEEFDDLVLGDRHWTDDPAEYVGGITKPRRTGDFMGSGSAGKVDGGITRISANLGFSDCGHDDWRPGLVLDPFGGSGTTALVATGHGRDCTLIDLDERNYELALDRVGPLILERAL